MSNDLANNAELLDPIDRRRYLWVNKSGRPINKQVPRTIQIYEGGGGETINYTGESDIYINADNLGSDLTVRFGGDIQNIRNWVSRSVAIHIHGITGSNVILDTDPVRMSINGTDISESVHTVVVNKKAMTLLLYFSQEEGLSLDYGASAGAIVPAVLPVFNNLGTPGVYRDTIANVVNLKRIIGMNNVRTIDSSDDITIQDYTPQTAPFGTSYNYMSTIVGIYFGSYFAPRGITNLSFIQLDGTTEGTISLFDSLSFTFTPAPRSTAEVMLLIRLESIQAFATMTVKLKARLTNVFDSEYLVGTGAAAGAHVMYDANVAPGAIAKTQLFPLGGNALTTVNSNVAAMDIADNVLFYTLTTSPNIIRNLEYTEPSPNVSSVFLDVSTTSAWTGGATIADMDYNELVSGLYVLPNNPTGRMLFIPIIPYNRAAGGIKMGAVVSMSMNLPLLSLPHSIAVCTTNTSIYISYKPTIGNVVIAQTPAFGNNNIVATQATAIAAGDTKMVVSTQGRLYLASQSLLTMNRISYGKTITDGLTLVYAIPTYPKSLFRNGYGCRQSP